MSINEIRDRINKLEESRFYLSMKDRWSNEDFDRDAQMLRELAELRRKVREVEDVVVG